MIPVDLNSIMFKTESILDDLHELFRNKEKSAFYKNAKSERQLAINKILWDAESFRWADLNRKTNELHLEYLYIAGLAPLWSGVKPPVDSNLILRGFEELFLGHISGIPASNVSTGQQWDQPNVWAPYHQWLVEYLVKDNQTAQLGFDIAQRFVSTVYCGWKKSGNIYEKYDADRIGERGKGGEYLVQEGFGWTNGVCISFLNMFGDRLVSPRDCDSSLISSSSRLISNSCFIGLLLVFKIIFITKY
jgi:alpha,alpha-trehalase